MLSQKDRQSMENRNKCYNTVLQSSAKGISAAEIARKLGIHRTTVHSHLSSLELTGNVESKHGLWYAKTGEQTTKPLEKEIVIELPLPKNQWQQIAHLEAHAKYSEAIGFPETARIQRTILETFRETRTIRIKGKNIDDLDLEKIGHLIQQANEKSSKVNLKGLFKNLKRSRPDSSRK